MFARELFEDVKRRGWPGVEQWKKKHASESVHLEFKVRDKDAPRRGLSQKDRALLAKAVSGFANTGGGLYVLGVHAKHQKDKPDVVVAIKPIEDVRFVADEVARRSRQHVEPTVAGLEVDVITTADGADDGIVMLLVPASDGGPHRVVGTECPGYDGQFYMRTARDTEPASYQYIAALFGRPPQPLLRLTVERTGVFELRCTITNAGRGWARKGTLVRFAVKFTDGREVPYAGQHLGPGWGDTWLPDREKWQVCAQLTGNALCPGDIALVWRFEFPDNPEVMGYLAEHGARIYARIDAENAQPVTVDEAIPPAVQS